MQQKRGFVEVEDDSESDDIKPVIVGGEDFGITTDQQKQELLIHQKTNKAKISSSSDSDSSRKIKKRRRHDSDSSESEASAEPKTKRMKLDSGNL